MKPQITLYVVVALLGAATISGIWLHGRSTGASSERAACEALIGEAERVAMLKATEATRQQRARAEALAVANDNLQRIADDLLSQNRAACPLDDDTRGRLLRIRPSYPDPASSSP